MAFDFGNNPLGGAAPRRGKTAGFMKKPNPNDPLKDVEYTGNVETDAAVELDELAKGFRERRDKEAERFKNATDSEYWFAVCFRTRADKERFINAVDSTTRIGDKYIDGHALAKSLGIDLEE